MYDEYGNPLFDPAEHDQRLGAIEAYLHQAHAATQHQAALAPYVRHHMATLARLKQRNPDVNPQTLIDLTLAAGHGNLERTYHELYGDEELARARREGREQGRRDGYLRALAGEPKRPLVPPAAETPSWDEAYRDKDLIAMAYDVHGERVREADPDSYRRTVTLMQMHNSHGG